MPRELNSPILIPQLLVGLWSTLRLVAGSAPVGVAGRGALESPLDCKEIQPVHPKGDESWVFIGRTDVEAETPILWTPRSLPSLERNTRSRTHA